MEQTKLEMKDIQCYPIVGDNALKVFIKANSRIGIVRGISHWKESNSTLISVELDNYLRIAYSLDEIKPILRPISDLYKTCLPDGKIPIVELAKLIDNGLSWSLECQNILGVNWNLRGAGASDKDNIVYYFDYKNDGFTLEREDQYVRNHNIVMYVPNQIYLYEYLFKHHFDIHGLIEKGLAIDMNTIENK